MSPGVEVSHPFFRLKTIFWLARRSDGPIQAQARSAGSSLDTVIRCICSGGLKIIDPGA